ncbi:flagellar protein FlaG [Nitrincola tapanii]|uniref:Flagellar protein FlaG n=1 Tax=Nitrincola tapanii TaxID=1708751 RepID=A0A5A9W794_9GAMM|nr:flagellar protein FlaG [Nitrincola tapanii]KAA0876592.1 flagellar protein FlaG [Nitrincola tapanii]
MSVESLGMALSVSPEAAKLPEVQTPPASASSTGVPVTSRSAEESVQLSPEQIDETVEKLEEAIDQLNSLMRDGQRALNFSVERDINKVVVKVMDVETEEVIRQFPDEQALKFAKHLEGMMGLLFNEKA